MSVKSPAKSPVRVITRPPKPSEMASDKDVMRYNRIVNLISHLPTRGNDKGPIAALQRLFLDVMLRSPGSKDLYDILAALSDTDRIWRDFEEGVLAHYVKFKTYPADTQVSEAHDFVERVKNVLRGETYEDHPVKMTLRECFFLQNTHLVWGFTEKFSQAARGKLFIEAFADQKTGVLPHRCKFFPWDDKAELNSFTQCSLDGSWLIKPIWTEYCINETIAHLLKRLDAGDQISAMICLPDWQAENGKPLTELEKLLADRKYVTYTELLHKGSFKYADVNGKPRRARFNMWVFFVGDVPEPARLIAALK